VLSVAIEEILVDGVPNSDRMTFTPKKAAANAGLGAKSLVIKPGKHRIEVRYTGLNFDAPESLRFRYRLEGSDPDWMDAGRQRAAFYNYVPPGDYPFRVMACNADGIWSAGAAEVTLSVMRHFWQTWWFIGLAGVGFLTSVGGTVRSVEKRRMQKRLERLERERALERERTRIAQDLHDEMGAKLCRILFLSEHVRRPALKPSELQPEMDSIALASREVLQSLDEIVWAVNPRNDSLEHVASYIGQYTQDYFHRTGIECELAIPAEFPFCPLSSQTRHHLFLATHEALTNILKHSGATKAEVSMKYENGALEIRVSDNGKGFVVPAREDGNGAPGSDTGDGLRNMRQRLQDVGGDCTIQTAPEKGTTIRFVLPLNGAVTMSNQDKNR
jgi:signal transduction histidine kinase